ncbi:MAG TPA: pyridoxamine 5'-phosphate oxidase family protein [Acidimicrobiales bacterium]|nr:pyridoxamine 5'-phosphate oxidase family protein [Acidimicrobiales bacterium]
MPLIDSEGSEVMGRPECLARLAQAAHRNRIGRVGIAVSGAPHVVPVNFSYFDQTVLVRLSHGFLASEMEDSTVAFEVDEHDAATGTSWSVLVRGFCRRLSGEEVERAAGILPEPVVASPGGLVFAIRTDVVSGRLVRRPGPRRGQEAGGGLSSRRTGSFAPGAGRPTAVQ